MCSLLLFVDDDDKVLDPNLDVVVGLEDHAPARDRNVELHLGSIGIVGAGVDVGLVDDDDDTGDEELEDGRASGDVEHCDDACCELAA